MKLLVQEYLRSGKTLDDLKLEHGVNHRIYNSKISLNYDQVESRELDILAQQCRGLVLRENTYDAICIPMFRFFNYGAGACAPIDWSNVEYLEKLDGCLDENTNILTEDGLVKIKDICEFEKKCKVYSINLDTMTIELDEIVDFSIKKNINNWYEIELDDGSLLKLTETHKVFIPKLGCYRQVKDLEGNEEFLLIEKLDT